MRKKLIDALTKCAQAHKVDHNLYDYAKGDTQFAVFSTSVPVISDLQMIAEAFFGQSRMVVCPDYGWGFTTFLLDAIPMRETPDMNLLQLALPCGTTL